MEAFLSAMQDFAASHYHRLTLDMWDFLNKAANLPPRAFTTARASQNRA
jgi:hypothetical protein